MAVDQLHIDPREPRRFPNAALNEIVGFQLMQDFQSACMATAKPGT